MRSKLFLGQLIGLTCILFLFGCPDAPEPLGLSETPAPLASMLAYEPNWAEEEPQSEPAVDLENHAPPELINQEEPSIFQSKAPDQLCFQCSSAALNKASLRAQLGNPEILDFRGFRSRSDAACSSDSDYAVVEISSLQEGVCFAGDAEVENADVTGPFVRDPSKKIVVIGAGPTSLGFLTQLYQKGALRRNHTIVAYESQSKPGGLSQSERDEQGFLWDFGGHVIFSHYQYFDDLLNAAVPNWNQKQRHSYAFTKGSDEVRRFIPYPVQNNIHKMSKVDRDRAFLGLRKVCQRGGHPQVANFQDWLIAYFGFDLFELFARPYNLKVWTVPPEHMNAEWVGERVAIPDCDAIAEKIAEEERRESNLEYAGFEKQDNWGPNSLFRFPAVGGTGAIWKNVADRLPSGFIQYGKEILSVDPLAKHVFVRDVPSGEVLTVDYDYLVSTMPLDKLIDSIRVQDPSNTNFNEAIEELKIQKQKLVRSTTHVVGIGLKGEPPLALKDKSWLYFPDADSPFYRITVFSNYSDDHAPKGHWSVMCETAEAAHAGQWTKAQIIESTIQALVEYGFIERHKIRSTYHKSEEHGYPVPSIQRDEALLAIQPVLESWGIFSRGRFGGWKYEVGNQDHSLMQGVELADFILDGTEEITYPKPNEANKGKNSDRTYPQLQSDATQPEIEIVVANYKEDLSWLSPVCDLAHVYNKAGAPFPQVPIARFENLKNVGRESHTYLHHIIRNYDHLADVTLFLQGHVGDHMAKGMSLSALIENAKEHGLATLNDKSVYADWGRIEHGGKWKEELLSGHMRPANLTFGEFWEEIFSLPHPSEVEVSFGACFGVSKERILKRPKAFYEKIQQFIDDHVNPEEGHYLERLWPALFTA